MSAKLLASNGFLYRIAPFAMRPSSQSRTILNCKLTRDALLSLGTIDIAFCKTHNNKDISHFEPM
jgi:hypothetical protein